MADAAIYKVRVVVGDCASEFSDNASSAVTGLFETPSLAMYPNPVTDQLRIIGMTGDLMSAMMFDNVGRAYVCNVTHDSAGCLVDVRNFVPGTYVLKITGTRRRYNLRIIKR